MRLVRPKRRTDLVIAVMLAISPLTVFSLTACDRVAVPSTMDGTARIGGPFQLVDTHGRAVTEQNLLGKPTAIFFGFTYCPDVCPTTLIEMSEALKELGPDADRLNVVFVSVDPERDTPAQLKLFLSGFDPRIQGFTGSPVAIESVTKAYRVYHKKVAVEGGGYTVDHSSAVYLFDSRGVFVEPIGYGSPHERVMAQLKALARGA